MEWIQAMMSHWSCVFLQFLCSLLLRFSLCFPLFSLFLWRPKMGPDVLLWYSMISFEMNQWPFILPILSQLASRVGLLAMASWAFFPSGFLPRQPEGLNRLHSPPEWICSPWRVNMCFCLFLAFSTRHGELENLGGEQLWPSTLTFAFLHVFLAS